jgi:hypothetical protein
MVAIAPAKPHSFNIELERNGKNQSRCQIFGAVHQATNPFLHTTHVCEFINVTDTRREVPLWMDRKVETFSWDGFSGAESRFVTENDSLSSKLALLHKWCESAKSRFS